MNTATATEGAELEFHPIANVTPLIEGREFDDLVASIKANGLREPIVLYEGKILDGRNRYRACWEAGVKPLFVPYGGDDPVSFVLDLNVHRRHMSIGQRAIVAAKMCSIVQGRNKAYSGGATTMAEAAAQLRVNRDTVVLARKLLDDGTPQEIEAVQNNQRALTTTARAIRRRTINEGKSSSSREDIMSVGKNRQRRENMMVQAELWTQLRVALDALTTLPLPEDVAAMVVKYKKNTEFTDKTLDRALEWLGKFQTEFNNARSGSNE